MFDGVLDPRWEDWHRDKPQVARPSVSPSFIAMLVVFAMLSIVAAIAYPEVFAAGLEHF
jgi:hypothetical protein